MADDDKISVEQQLKSEKSSQIYRKAVKKALEMEEESDDFRVEKVEMNFALPPSVKIVFSRVEVAPPAPKAPSASKPAPKPAAQSPAQPAQPAAASDPYTCPTCHNKYRYIEQYKRWYCDTCKKYP